MKTGLILLALLYSGETVRAQVAHQDADLRAHLVVLGNKLDDAGLTTETRERTALEMAATLDRAALAAASPVTRRAYWAEAAQTLDGFSAKNPSHPARGAFRVQASVYLWARARTWLRAFETNPADAEARSAAEKALTDTAGRLRASLDTLPPNASDVFAQNVRYRTAQAVADLAAVLPDAASRQAKNVEARRLLEPVLSEPSLTGFADLLRGVLDARLGAFEQARREIESAAGTRPPPPPADLLDARLELLLGSRKFDEALKAVETAPLEATAKPALRVRVRLAERAGTAEVARRKAAESALFAELGRLRDANRPDARAALFASALGIPEPNAEQDPSAWDLLAAGALLLGDPGRAGDLERRGAARAEALKKPDVALDLLSRAGAYLFQAGKFEEADGVLSRVADGPGGGPTRARAGLLRVLSRGRALALKRPGASEASYTAALTQQIKAFPDDPSTAEARWLLGKLRAAESDHPGALALWGEIRHGEPRWLESRVEAAALRQKELDDRRASGDRAETESLLNRARASLASCLAEARGESETVEILLASARLELTPKLGRAPEALAALERVQKSAATPPQRGAARRLTILALAATNRWVEVEQRARQEALDSPPADLIGLVRLIDRAAAEADSDLKTRRLGHVARILLTRALEQLGDLDPAIQAEVHLRLVRALLFSGDEAGARRTLMVNSQRLPSKGDDELRDLAETYMKLGAFSLALDVYRLRVRNLDAGSLPWFEARYGLALAAYRAGKPKEAVQLIDGTAILHPDLGGGELREKFLHLRQRIGPGGE